MDTNTETLLGIFKMIGSLAKLACDLLEPTDTDKTAAPTDDNTPSQENTMASLPLLEDAILLVQKDYDSFDDVIGSDGDIDTDRLAEYVSVIEFRIHDIASMKDRFGSTAKYPKFLDRFNVSSANEITLKMVLQEFNAGQWERNVEADTRRDQLAQSAGYLMSVDPDFGRAITDDERAYCKKEFGVDLDGYATISDIGAELDLDIPTADELSGYSYGDTPVEIDDIVNGMTDAQRKMIFGDMVDQLNKKEESASPEV